MRAVDYDEIEKTLDIEFNNGVIYRYVGVPKDQVDALLIAPSKGEYFASAIKKAYPFKKL